LSSALATKIGIPVLGITSVAEFRDAEAAREPLLAASQPLLHWPQRLPDGRSIERPELKTLMHAADAEEGTATVLLGTPGSGKTALLAKFAEELRANDIPFLAIKADLLNDSVATEEDLQKDLRLPALPSEMLL